MTALAAPAPMLKLQSYWLDTAPAFAGADGPIPDRADVVVVGGGFTGLSAARTLARKGATVVVLEARGIAGEASGVNGGHCNNGLSHSYADMAERIGADRARAFYRAFDGAVDTVERIVTDERIACEFVRAGKLKLLAEVRRELGVSCLFISHDLATVRAVCDEIVVMSAGRKVESAPREAMARPPRHPYSDLLIASMPELRRGWLDELDERRWSGPGPAISSRGSVRGCSFVDRCAVKVPGVCDAVPPPRRQFGNRAEILCHRTEAELIELQQLPAKTA
jgi:oligopeptide/dipeptide ABC transporter ATP-binding protein